MILIAYWLGVVLGVCAILWVASVFIDWRMTRAEKRECREEIARFWAEQDAYRQLHGEIVLQKWLRDTAARDRLAEFEAVAAAAWGRDE